MKKILAAMSGGVDSAAAALLLLRAGYEVEGGTMLLRSGGEAEAEDASRVCRALGIPFHCFDFRSAFEQLVIEPFGAVYRAGGTPNPCVVCNRRVKFGLLLDRALEAGFDGIATGHYARITRGPDGLCVLRTAHETARDQSYFLYSLTQRQLSHALMPLGDYTKSQVRALAQEAGLPVAAKRDSQDICFVPDGDYLAYLRGRGLEPQPGNFLLDGVPVAPHAGQEAYTLGQRRGLGYAAGRRIYVVGKRGSDVLLGDEAALYTASLRLAQLRWIAPERPDAPFSARCKLRSGPRQVDCTVQPLPDGGAVVRFSEPQRAAAPGQSAVFYQDDTVLGGGEIAGTEQWEESTCQI